MGPVVTTTDPRPQRRVLRWAGLVGLAGASGCADTPELVVDVASSPPACVAPGPVVPLSPGDGLDRHHPTADRASDGTVWVTWQRGMRPAAIEVASFTEALTPRTAPVVLSGSASRPTHPQVAVGGGRRVVVWTEEDTAALRLADVDATGHPTGSGATWAGVRGMPLYPDVVLDASGTAWVVWYEEAERPAWWWVSVDPKGEHTAPRALAEAHPWWGGGGPAGMALAASGEVVASWGEVVWRPPGAPAATLYVAPLGGAEAPVAWRSVVGNAQRVALGVAGNGAPSWGGWSRYPGGSATAGVAWSGPDGEVVTKTPGRMLDLLVVGPRAWVAWDAPSLGVVAAPAADAPGCAGLWRVADPATHAERPVWVAPHGDGVALIWQAGARRVRSIYGQTLVMR